MLNTERKTSFLSISDQIVEFFSVNNRDQKNSLISGFEIAEKHKESIALILTNIPKSPITTNPDIIRENIRQEVIEEDEEDTTTDWSEEKWHKKINIKIKKAKKDNLNFFQQSNPYPSKSGIIE